MNDPTVYQQLGSLQAEVTNLKGQVTAVDEKLDTLLERSAKARGAASMLWRVGSVSSAGGGVLVAIAAWWIEHFGGRAP